jgi:hypothetical protein
LATAVFTLVLVPLANANQPTQQIIQIQSEADTQANRPPQSITLPAGGAVSISQHASQVQVQTLDPSQPQRLLVRLKDQPLRPYLKQQREKMRAMGKLSRAQRQQLSKSSQTHLQRVQKSQSQLLGELRKQKMVGHVHHQFTQLTNTLVITAEAGTIEQIRRLPQVAAIYPDAEVKALLTESVAITKAPQVWAMLDSQSRTATGRGITVAVLDTGIDHTHPDLGGCIGAGCKVAGGYNFMEGENTTNTMDRNGHGTHVAGIIAAKGTLTGVAPDVTLYAYKVLGDLGSGNDSGIIAALEKAADPDGDPLTDDQIDIVNMSLGGAGAPDSPLSEAANNAMAAGVVVVAAAGNSGSSYSTIDSPGNAEQILTIGASENNGLIAEFSSRGPVTGRAYVKPELVAPGVEIISTQSGGGFVSFSGTSMAAPHVAGGAALLKQLHPNLTAAELKTLLINSSQDLGQDVFTQGAGLINLAQAANAKILVSPAFLLAGKVSIAEPSWSKDLVMTIKNISNSALTFAAAAPSAMPAGAAASVAPVGEQELAAGQEASIKLNLLIDTQTLPFPNSSTLNHEATANVRYASTDVRVPLIFSKTGRLKVEFDAPPHMLHVISDDGSYGSVEYFNSCTETPKDFGVDLAPGTYHLAAAFYGQDCGMEALVFKEDVQLEYLDTTKIERASAIHDLAVGSVTGLDGNAVSLENMRNISKSVQWNMTNSSRGDLYFLDNNEPTILQVSTFSNRFQMKLDSFFALREVAPGVAGEFYLLSDSHENGIQSSQYLNLDLREAGGVDFTYADLDMLAQGVTFSQRISQMWPRFGFSTYSTYRKYDTAHYQPFSVKLYAELSTIYLGEFYPSMWVERLTDDPSVTNIKLMDTGSLAFIDTESFTKLDRLSSLTDETNYRSPSRQLTTSNSAYFMAPVFYFKQGDSKELLIRNLSGGTNHSFQRDAQQNSFFDSIPYQLYCNGELRISSTIRSDLNLPLGNGCSSLVFEMNQPVRYLGESSNSKLRLELDATKLLWPYQALLTAFPEQLQFFSKPSTTSDGTDLSVQLTMVKLNTEVFNESVAPTMEYRLSGSTDWLPLSLVQNEMRYTAKLPTLEGDMTASLRISIFDPEKGAKIIQTVENVLLLGKGTASEDISRPVFLSLLFVGVEATGPLTSYSFPPVYAEDPIDGLIQATTTDTGPYRLGLNRIRWQATNSAGETSIRIQELMVQDSSAPVINVPANITVVATGEFTEISQPEVKAQDRVDGEITARTADWKPFPIGTSYVTWNARDTRGNRSSIVQTVTVNVAAASSESQVSSSSSSSSLPATSSQPQASSSAASNTGNTGGGGSGGGGGGVATLWLLLLCSLLFYQQVVASRARVNT